MYRGLCLVVILVTASVIHICGQRQQLAPVKELKGHWLTVGRDGSRYVPYITGSSVRYPVIGIILNGEENAGLILKCCIQSGTAIFVNNQIVDRTESEGCVFYDVDSLMASYGQNSLFLSFFRQNLDPVQISTVLMTRRLAEDLQEQSNPPAQITKRNKDQFANFFVIAILLVTSFYAFLINRYPKGHRDFFNIQKAFSLTLKEEKVLTQRNMSTVNTLFLWLYGMILSLLIILFWEIFGGVPDLFGFVGLETFQSCFISWLALSLIVFCVVELKYLLIKILCSLLNVDKIAQIHFFDFVRISLIFVGTTLLSASLLYLSDFDQLMPFRIVLYIFIMLLGIRIVVLLFKLIGDTSFRKIHLISYLCTTEILPLLVGIRIFF